MSELQKKNEELQNRIMQLERNLTSRLEGERQSSEMVQQMTQAVKKLERELHDKNLQLQDTMKIVQMTNK